MDKVFQEEQKKLAEVESKIDVIASRYEAAANKLQAEIADFWVIDHEDLQNKQYLISQRTSNDELSKKYRSYQPSPYFGRLDLDREVGDTIETTTHYIGKEGISDSADVIVVDWRSPIGNLIHVKNQKNFTVNGVNYTLALRRSLNIRNGQLLSCHTEYDGETVSLDGDVIDPFLLTVLKDKRRHNRLTDIIRTIQGNQNEIIRKPRSESFVVQGCAGSGKTMILLHRLSYLKFNNRTMSLANVKIITPNKFFDAHINDLSVELGLTAIERFSVEEYYVHLIKKFSSKLAVDANVQSEKILSADLLADVYSLQYLNNSISHYHEYWEQILADLQESELREYFAKFSLPYPDTSIHTNATFSLLEQALRQMASKIAEAEKKIKTVVQRLETISSEMKTVQSELASGKEQLASIKRQTVSRIEVESAGIEDAVHRAEERIAALKTEQEEIQAKRKKLEDELRQATASISVFAGGASGFSEYDQFILRNDAASQIIRKECSGVIREISDLETAYQKIPVYNFGKRNTLRKQVAEKKSQFALDVTNFITTLHTNAERKISELRDALEVHNRENNTAGESIREEEKNIRAYKIRSSAFAECLEVLNSSDMPDTQSVLTLSTHKMCAEILSTYEKQRIIVSRFSRRLTSYETTKADIEREQVQLSQSTYTQEDIEYISGCSKTIKKLQMSEVTRNVMFRDLLSRYRLHKQKYLKTNYRHKIYLKLLYCALYFARPVSPDTFLNIDEAQDISIAEYKLLRMVLGEKCIFNLYGDINQSVYSYKGIMDWDDIADITTGNIYVLNENYRNTIQITDFCNKEFGAEVYPIGVSGDEVFEAKTEAAIKWILDLKKSNPDFRVAIIHRHGLKAIQECLRSQLSGQDVSWYFVDDKKLSVLSVEMAKGLEFEAVVAIVDQMSNNEKYISYTRALDRLAVVRDHFSSELDIDDAEEDIDDEFAEQTEAPDVDPVQLLEQRQNLLRVVAAVLKQKSAMPAEQGETTRTTADTHPTGRFFSWEIIDEMTAVKTCDKSFFEHNETGVPRDISWFFCADSIVCGDSKNIDLLFNGRHFVGKVSREPSEHARIRISWNTDLADQLKVFRNIETSKAVFQKELEGTYNLTIVETQDELEQLKTVLQKFNDQPNECIKENDDSASRMTNTGSTGDAVVNSKKVELLSPEDTMLIAEFNAVLEDRFGSEHRLSAVQQSIVLALYHGHSIACNAPSGSMKNVMLYLLALKEHQMSGKQTLLTADAHLQENELVLADRLGLKGGIINTMEEFSADFKKDKYDVIFVSYDFFRQHENIAPFVDCFMDKVAYWGLDHPASAKDIWPQLNNCGSVLDAIMFLMAKADFADLDLTNYRRIDITGETDKDIAQKHTLVEPEEKLKWLLANLGDLTGQGLIYCDDEVTCKILSKCLRKNKIMAEAYINVTNPEKKEHINYLTNSFSNGGLPILVTTHEAGKNLSNPHIRFIVHFDVPVDEKLYKLHVAQIGRLASDAVVHDLYLL